jgi:hypothetical protein
MDTLLPGFLQGITRVLISYPFDYVRLHLQMNQTMSLRSYVTTSSLTFRQAYRGCSVPLTVVPIDRALQFALFEHLKERPAVAAAVGSLFSAVYAVPANYLSTLLITGKTIEGGLRGFLSQGRTMYRGGLPDFTRSFSGGFLYMWAYGTLRERIPTDKHNYFLFGIASSLFSWSIVYPLDTLRVLKQTEATHRAPVSLRGAYRGFLLLAARTLPSAGAGMWVYETSRRSLLFATMD